ncbi:hypothetical protein C4A75_09415 [Brevibacillus laterosporus]|uniref:hypothetical protein n=1 Tax=Brevibacillus laterosporus TaxID=1465 RepID=UPI000CE4117D|nr:hypothetical protein [Brevibacillus laterosporus]PPA84985.1 hypothetical protein C4A75_09415 [Brevibacillus laterosporus]
MMDDIHIYLLNGMRVVIQEPACRFERLVAAFRGCLQKRKWYGWSTISSVGISDIDITELDQNINEIIRELMTEYERKLKEEQARREFKLKEKQTNIQLQAKYHGKVLTELELQMILEGEKNENGGRIE